MKNEMKEKIKYGITMASLITLTGIIGAMGSGLIYLANKHQEDTLRKTYCTNWSTYNSVRLNEQGEIVIRYPANY